MKFIKFIWHLPRNLAISFVALYQKTLSPDHSRLMKGLFPHGHCKYRPSCSDYTKLTLKKNGFVIGSAKSVWRALRCNPWSKGGWDSPAQ